MFFAAVGVARCCNGVANVAVLLLLGFLFSWVGLVSSMLFGSLLFGCVAALSLMMSDAWCVFVVDILLILFFLLDLSSRTVTGLCCSCAISFCLWAWIAGMIWSVKKSRISLCFEDNKSLYSFWACLNAGRVLLTQAFNWLVDCYILLANGTLKKCTRLR